MTLLNRRSFLPIASGDGIKYTGWQEPLPSLTKRLLAAVQGVRERLRQPTEDVSAWSGAVLAEREFHPDPNVGQYDEIDAFNYIVRSGVDYRIPIKFTGPGVFLAQYLKISCFMKFQNPSVGEDQWLPIAPDMCAFSQIFSQPQQFAIPYSCYPVQPSPGSDPGAYVQVVPMMNFAWNIENPRTGRLYASTHLSGQMQKPRSWYVVDNVPPADDERRQNLALPDGGLFDFIQPYVMERDGQLTLVFRALTDFIQFDSSIPGQDIGLPFDDRVNGQRDQTVKVQVELHGARFETMQDLVRSGALTFRW